HVTRLLAAFRDWFEGDEPSDGTLAVAVARLLGDPATEFLLGGVERGAPPCGVCQLRFRHSVWTDAPDCWLEDLYVEGHARGHGVGGALVRVALRAADRRRGPADGLEHNK